MEGSSAPTKIQKLLAAVYSRLQFTGDAASLLPASLQAWDMAVSQTSIWWGTRQDAGLASCACLANV